MPSPHQFQFVLAGPAVERALQTDAALDDLAERLFEAGCDDGTLARSGNEISIDFDRESASFEEAVASALADIRNMEDVNVRVVSPEFEFVTLAEIGRRCGVTRESVRLWASGKRGPGGFPFAVAAAGHSKLWRWSDVVAWCAARTRSAEQRERLRDWLAIAGYLSALNGALALSAVGPARAREVLEAVDPTLRLQVIDEEERTLARVGRQA
jgi:hypothetical protein